MGLRPLLDLLYEHLERPDLPPLLLVPSAPSLFRPLPFATGLLFPRKPLQTQRPSESYSQDLRITSEITYEQGPEKEISIFSDFDILQTGS